MAGAPCCCCIFFGAQYLGQLCIVVNNVTTQKYANVIIDVSNHPDDHLHMLPTILGTFNVLRIVAPSVRNDSLTMRKDHSPERKSHLSPFLRSDRRRCSGYVRIIMANTLAAACFTMVASVHSFTGVESPLLSLRKKMDEDASATTILESASSSSSELSSLTQATWWDDVPQGPPDAILGIAQAFRECTDARKVNICVGAYRDAQGKPWILPSVQEAEARLLQQQAENPFATNKEYLPIEGDGDFLKQAMQFAYGNEIVQQYSIAAVQSLSGTGACRIGGHFLKHFTPPSTTIYIPVPTWGNHWNIFKEAGLPTQPYRYYNAANNQLDFSGFLEDVQQAPPGSIILLHACAHNPTGCDPTQDQWKKIADTMAERQHIAFFDSAYQGFASGDAERDAWALRYFGSRGDISVLLAQSFAKNFGLYGERCGTLSVVTPSPATRDRVLSQLRCIIRPMYSSPPKHGSSIVKTVLSDPTLAEQYTAECRVMADRIAAMRQRLVQALADAGSVHDWSHIQEQIGMFAFTGMNSAMCDRLTEDYAIFLTRDGRISLAGLNEGNVDYVAQSVHIVTEGQSITTAVASTAATATAIN
jgi:aspartate aminotransferase, mitochondrial